MDLLGPPGRCRREMRIGRKVKVFSRAANGCKGLSCPGRRATPSETLDCGLTIPDAADPNQAVVRQNPGRIEFVDFPCLQVRHFPTMMLTILRLFSVITTSLKLRSELALENPALRQQLAVLNRRHRRSKLRKLDSASWLLLA